MTLLTQERQLKLKTVETVDVDGYFYEIAATTTIDFSKSLHYITIKVGGTAGMGDSVLQAIRSVSQEASIKALEAIAAYRERSGLGTQGDLFNQEPLPGEA